MKHIYEDKYVRFAYDEDRGSLICVDIKNNEWRQSVETYPDVATAEGSIDETTWGEWQKYNT